MNRQYRVVNFVADPFVGPVFPIAVVVEAGGPAMVELAPFHPGPACLGSEARARAWGAIRDLLPSIRSLHEQPPGLGPHVRFSEPMAVPHGVDAREWVRHLFARPPDTLRLKKAVKEPSRGVIGENLFKRLRVIHYVKRRFKATEADLKQAVGLRPVTHYVPGPRSTLLLEPFVPGKTNLPEALEHLVAYNVAINAGPSDRHFRLLTYMLSGGSADERRFAERELRERGQLVDTSKVRGTRQLKKEVMQAAGVT